MQLFLLFVVNGSLLNPFFKPFSFCLTLWINLLYALGMYHQMANNWFDCISSDLVQVEKVMSDITARADNPLLKEMCDYVLSNHGKRIRPSICLLSYYALGGTESKHVIDLGAAIEIIHNATLIHDDINDNGELRRGAKALYKQYSLGRSIVAGDFLFALGFQLMGSSSAEVVGYVIDAATSMGSGEFDQKKFEHNKTVTEKEYVEIISGKTARLIECASKCGAYVARPQDFDAIERLGNYSYNLGLAFQIIDDLLDVIGDTDNTGKCVGNDLVEGKPTLPTIYGMEDPVHGERIRQIFENEHTDYALAHEAIALIKQTDSIERCYALANHYADLALEYLEPIEDSVYKQALIDFTKFIVSRDR